MDAFQAVESVARASYGRLVAYLSARSQDVAGAEDALSEAFRCALETWPKDGVPEKPEAWLLVVARRRVLDHLRHQKVRTDAVLKLRLVAEEAEKPSMFPDERLKLLFICAHPAINEGARTPLMLQTVLGLDAARIASAFLVAPTAMSQRLVRAKAKIRDAGIPFALPEPHELPTRLNFVMEAIYAAYSTGWDDVAGVDPRRRGLAEEAIWLARVVVQLMPGEAEARGLLALMLHCEARRQARRGQHGEYIPLSRQEVTLWSSTMIEEAERALTEASACRSLGRFQLEAAIQSVHAQRALTGQTNWEVIALLYEELVCLTPTLGALVGRAAALAEARGPMVGLAALEAVAAESVLAYQPYWAVRAHLLNKLGRQKEAQGAYTRAIGLSEDEQVRNFLIEQARSEG
ncbi:RNA polymerase sigma factor [Anthocerotibacter panamensis]|uniref:RNA polymerase sigma factor n=1 Tax=Anthocerotibacter panamensis TaxID=2857077 RepID=UPI001C404554|nr:DUF6596 domain-containing protein [Anthocerotibacter panamensis]